MKHFFLTLCVITILFSFPASSGLSFDNSPDDGSKNGFNIVLITIDALRADHLSCYGYGRKTSPNIDKIAEQGIIFKGSSCRSVGDFISL